MYLSLYLFQGQKAPATRSPALLQFREVGEDFGAVWVRAYLCIDFPDHSVGVDQEGVAGGDGAVTGE